tara:strand:- start:817 stop:1038 length:222 start_codon:yes stop_codon:yes gene_type:complete
MVTNKLGSYINQLMTTVVDKEQSDFVKDLALGELKRLNLSVGEFIDKHKDDDTAVEKTVKQLLQEEKENVKDK